jgi:hypothetical protein
MTNTSSAVMSLRFAKWASFQRHYLGSGGRLHGAGCPGPVPAINAPAISYQLQQGFWGGAQARVAPRGAPCEALQMSGTEGLAVTGAGGR